MRSIYTRKQETLPGRTEKLSVRFIRESSCSEGTMRALLILIFVWVFSPLESKHPPGHLQPLGSHQPPLGSIKSTDFVPGAPEFFKHNALPGEPLLFKGAAKNMPAYSKWTDQYLR